MDALGAAARNPFTLAERLLGIVAGALDTNVPYSRPAPDHQYVAHGTPVLDLMDQLTVHLSNIRPSLSFEGDTAGIQPQPRLILVDLVTTLVGCYPTGVLQQAGGKVKALPAETLSEASEQSYVDGWVAYSAVLYGWKTDCSSCENYTLSPLQPLDAEGGAAGWQFTLTTEIPHLRQEL